LDLQTTERQTVSDHFVFRQFLQCQTRMIMIDDELTSNPMYSTLFFCPNIQKHLLSFGNMPIGRITSFHLQQNTHFLLSYEVMLTFIVHVPPCPEKGLTEERSTSFL